MRPPRAEVPKAAEESLEPPDAAEGNGDTDNPAPPGKRIEPAEDLPPVKRDADAGARAPLPKPFPEADDGAAAPAKAPRRARRRILLDQELDRELDGEIQPARVIPVEHAAPVQQRGGTPWRSFASKAPEPPDLPVPVR